MHDIIFSSHCTHKTFAAPAEGGIIIFACAFTNSSLMKVTENSFNMESVQKLFMLLLHPEQFTFLCYGVSNSYHILVFLCLVHSI